MASAMARHDALVRAVVAAHGGEIVKMTGDGGHAVFGDPLGALSAVIALQLNLLDTEATASLALKVRCGLHCGDAQPRDHDYFGSVVNRAARIMSAAHGGQILLSESVAQRVGSRLPEGVGLLDLGKIRLRDLSTPEHVYQVEHVQLRREFPALRSLESHPNNLEQQPTSFIGREHELQDVEKQLRSARLVTLVGTGGLGKTRLALQCGAEVLDAFADGVWVVDLAPLRDPALLPSEVAKVLGVREEPARPLTQTLTMHLKSRNLLLILDGCEHLAHAGASLANAVLRGTAGTRILVTSREALHVPGEHIYPLLPLPVPKRGDGIDTLSRLAAVELFVDRAQSSKPTFELTEWEAAEVAELVARLEGIPLALELAAARVRTLSIAEINARLKDRYKLLTRGSPVVLERQQTLRALVDWSYDLLHENERTLFARLSVFAGGFTLQAAEEICAFEPLARGDVLDLVTALAEKSLLQVEEGAGRDRYRMLDTIRDYARERLQGSGESLATASMHCEFYFALTKQVRDGLLGPDQAEWVDRMEADLDNVRDAIAMALSGNVDPFIAVKMSVALQGFWIYRGYVREGRAVIRSALALPRVANSDLAKGWALYVGAALAERQGEHAEARRMLETCLQLRQRLGSPNEIAATLSTLAEARLHSGDAEGAAECEREALQIFRDLGVRVGEAIGLLHLAHIYRFMGDDDQARLHLEQSLVLGREIRNVEVEGECEWLLGVLALDAGDVPSSYAHLERSLSVCKDAGEKHGEAIASWWLGKADLAAGKLDMARIRLTGAIRVLDSFEMYAETLGCLEDYAALAIAQGLSRDGVRHLAAAAAARDRLAMVLPPRDDAHRRATIAALRTELGDTAFDEAWSDGHALEITDAVRRAVTSHPSGPGPVPTA